MWSTQNSGPWRTVSLLAKAAKDRLEHLFPLQRGLGHGGPGDPGCGEVSKVDTACPLTLWVPRELCHGDSVALGKLPDLLGTLFLRCKLGGYEGNTLSFRGGLRGSRVRSREAVGARAHRSCPQS